MPNTPSVNINFVNKNVQPSTPQLGISHVLARTTKGPFNRPDEVLSTYAQFQAIYGEEIVPDGTISNIRSHDLCGFMVFVPYFSIFHPEGKFLSESIIFTSSYSVNIW